MLARVTLSFAVGATLLSCALKAQPNTFLPHPAPEHLALVADCISSHTGVSENGCIGLLSKDCLDYAATYDAKDQCVLYETFVWGELIRTEEPQLLAKLSDTVRKQALELEDDAGKRSQALCLFLQAVPAVDAARARFEARSCTLQSLAFRWISLRSLGRVAGK